MDYGARKRGYDDMREDYGGGMGMMGEGSYGYPATSRDSLRNSEVSCKLYKLSIMSIVYCIVMFMNYLFHSGPEEDVHANDR